MVFLGGLPRFLGSTLVEAGVLGFGSAEDDFRFRVKLYCGSPTELRLGRPVGDSSEILDVLPMRTFLLEAVVELPVAFRFLGGMIEVRWR